MQGPFRGLRIVVDQAVIDWPKVLGTYELELHSVFEKIIAAPPAVVVNVGAAEGYYAAGLAARCPGSHVVAFEGRPAMREHISRVSAANGVAERIEIRGWCDSEELEQMLSRHPGALLLVDIEGVETDLLDPVRIPGLAHCPMLVEEHDVMRPGCTQALLERFTPTHRIQVIRERPRRDRDLPIQWPLSRCWLRRLMRENRPGPQTWLYLVPVGYKS